MKLNRKLVSWRQFVYRLCIGLAVAQVILIFVSWLLSAAMPQTAIYSLLSGRGMRWFFGDFVKNEASAPLVWIILGVMAWGSLKESSFLSMMVLCVKSGFSNLSRRMRLAMVTSCLLGALQIGCLLLLVLPPQAVLLSVTGTVSGSSFSASIIPSACFIAVTTSIVYGLIGGTLHGVDGVCQSLCAQHAWLMPILLLYVLLTMFVSSIQFVFFSY